MIMIMLMGLVVILIAGWVSEWCHGQSALEEANAAFDATDSRRRAAEARLEASLRLLDDARAEAASLRAQRRA